jgi:CubicO group peptidase (beta-lactamase class C family)
VILLLFCIQLSQEAQAQHQIPEDISSWIDAQFEKGLDSLGIVGASIVLVHQDSIIHKGGYGVENIEAKTSIHPDTSIFTVASISKTFTATAIMQLYELGKIDLDTDVNTYLKSITIVYPFEDVITIRQLLTHTAGFDERNLATKVHSADESISLAEHLNNRMPPQIRRAGDVFDYSNYGFALLGLIVEDVSEVPFSDYVETRITKPLGMEYSGFKYDDKAQKHLVTSYLQKDGTLEGYGDYFSLNYPAGGFHATASDMGKYLRMYLNKGSRDHIQVLQPATIDKMWNEVYKNLPESRYGWGLGFEYYDWRGKKVMGHGGDILGFATDLRLLPDEDVGIYVAFNSSSIPGSVSKQFLNEFWINLLEKIFPEAQYVKNEVPAMEAAALALSEYEGTYRFTRYAHTTLDKLAVFIGFAPEITIEKKNDSLNIKEWDYSFYPTGDHGFFAPRNSEYVAFGKNANDEVAYFYLSGTEGYHKLMFYDTVPFQMIWIGIILILCFAVFARSVMRFISKSMRYTRLDHVQLITVILIFVFLAVVGYSLATTDPQEFLYGVPKILEFVLYLPFIIIALALLGLFYTVKTFQRKRSWFSVIIMLAFLGFIWWLYNWNLIGFNY